MVMMMTGSMAAMVQATRLQLQLNELAWVGGMIIKNVVYMQKRGLEIDENVSLTLRNRLLQASGLKAELLDMNDHLIREFERQAPNDNEKLISTKDDYEP